MVKDNVCDICILMRAIQLISERVRESFRVKKEVDSLQDFSNARIDQYVQVRKGLYQLYYKICMNEQEVRHQDCSEIWNLLYHSL